MKLWYKFTEKLPETHKELVLRSNECGLYNYESAMAIIEDRHLYIEHGLTYTDGTYKSYTSCEMLGRFRADKEENTEWCYLEGLCKLVEKTDEQ